MLDVVHKLIRCFGLTTSSSKIYVDASNPNFIRALKMQIGESEDFDQKLDTKSKFPKYDWTTQMLVIPGNFAQEHKKMLLNAKMIF